MKENYKGLTSIEVEHSREKYGANTLKKLKSKGFIRRFFDNLNDPIIKILLAALFIQVAFTFGNVNYFEILGIVSAILIATTVSTVSEYGSEKAFLKLERENAENKSTVIRNSRLMTVPTSELVVGDIIRIERGQSIGADAIILDGELLVDQSALNGENVEARKLKGGNGEGFELSNQERIFMGTVATDGEAIARVERIGEETFYGMVAKDVQAETRESPLKLRLSRLAKQISVMGYVVAILVGLCDLFFTFVVDNGFNLALISRSFSDARFVFSSLLEALTLMITVVVVAVPEGLPMMITVVLSANMKRMMRDNILVKKLVGIETAGSLNILFTDKTGTITTGKLSVDSIISDFSTFKNLSSLKKCQPLFDILTISSEYNTDVRLGEEGFVGGNATDRAICDFFSSSKGQNRSVVSKTPFSSEIKYSSVTLDDGVTYIKGAPEVVLPRCSYAVNKEGDYVASDLSYARREYKEALRKGERVIAVATLSNNTYVFTALIVLKDKIRKGVREAVDSITRAGIQIVMLTGDNKETATGIAEECGFFKESHGHVAISSEELSSLTDSELKELLPRIRVLSRALPQDKTRLVRISQELELVAGMTGDGINDAPSLKLADVGFAMGSGTDIAKSAGDIVILDNSFTSISKTVLYGRTIFKSIRKFITFQLIMNLAACGITLIGRFIGVDNPITIIQMLWVNIIMDTLGGLAFAGEAPLDYYMKEKPKRRDEPILSMDMIKHILLNGAFTLTVLVLFLKLPVISSVFTSNVESVILMSAFYALFIFLGIFNSFTARSDRMFLFSNILKNKLFVSIMLFISVIQVFIIYFGGSVFRSAPLSLSQLLWVLLLASSVLLFDTVRRIISKLK